MSADLVCYNCGHLLAALTLPISRRDLCPGCSMHLHVCRMCTKFDPRVTRQCREDDAEDVIEKERVNFCEWFEPSSDAYDAGRAGRHARAEADLASLFGDESAAAASSGDALEDVEKLFK